MILRLLIKAVTPVVVGSMLVGWANLDSSPAAKTVRAAAFGALSCGSCKRAGPAAVSQPAPHKQKTKPVVSRANERHETARHTHPSAVRLTSDPYKRFIVSL